MILGSILNYVVRLVVIWVQLAARQLHQRLLGILLNLLIQLRQRILLFITQPERLRNQPDQLNNARRYPAREHHQPDRLTYYHL